MIHPRLPLLFFICTLSFTSMVACQCSYDGIDFSPLINNATDWTGQDPSITSYFYRFNICRTTVSTYSGSSCPTGYSAYQLGTATGTSPCYANLGTWNSSTWGKVSNGYTLKYSNGRVCSGIPGTFTIAFECNRDGPVVPVPSPYFPVKDNGQCQYETTMQTSLACPNYTPSSSPTRSASLNCGVDGISFAGLILTHEDEPYYGNDTNGYDYQFNICAGVSSVCGPDSRGAVAYQYLFDNVPNTCQSLGSVISTREPYWRLDTNTSSSILATYYGGNVCGDKERQVTYRFVCGSSYYPAGSHVFEEVALCEYEVVIRTSLACTSSV